jgi:hypothetical protein
MAGRQRWGEVGLPGCLATKHVYKYRVLTGSLQNGLCATSCQLARPIYH